MAKNIVGDIIISGLAFSSLAFLFIKIRNPFKNHKFNTFAYIILLLIIYSLIVRSFFFFVSKDGIAPKLQGFLITYPCINLVICSYLLSN